MHLTHEDLLKWRDHGEAADRERVVGHLGACEECRHRLAEVVRAGPVERGRLDHRAFAPRGLSAYRKGRATFWGSPWAWLGATAAAATVGLVVVLATRGPPPEESQAVRGSELLAAAPVGEVADVREFRWSSPFAVSRYRVILRDHSGATLLTREAKEERLLLAAPLTRGRYTWTVEALDAAGRVVARARPQSFEVR